MKGVVFTEFFRMVENTFGYEVADTIVSEAKLPSGGVYTAVGTYPAMEMFALIGQLSKSTGMGPDQLQEAFGRYLFPRFAEGYPSLVEDSNSALDFLASIESYIHVEVLKLYPDAELPRFETKRLDENHLELVYHSKRKMSHFALGLIHACGDHFNTQLVVQSEALEADGSVVRFLVSNPVQ